jgi:AraC family transcriptional regulator
VKQETYQLPHHWSLHFYGYKGQIDCGDISYTLKPGACSIVPPGMPITFHYEGPSEHLYSHFSISEGTKPKNTQSEFIQNNARLPQLKSLLTGAIALTPARQLKALGSTARRSRHPGECGQLAQA